MIPCSVASGIKAKSSEGTWLLITRNDMELRGLYWSQVNISHQPKLIFEPFGRAYKVTAKQQMFFSASDTHSVTILNAVGLNWIERSKA